MENEEATESMNLMIEPSLKRQLEVIAERTERSLSATVRIIIRQYLDTKGHF